MKAGPSNSLSLRPIGTLYSPFKEKFGIPRQAGLIDWLPGSIRLNAPYNDPDSVRGLSEFSHLWLISVFHLHLSLRWKPLVRPPRLGGNQKIGVWASRSPFRPNPLGLSLVRLTGIQADSKGIELAIEGADLVDGTPIIDIKPYLPYADSIPDALAGFAPEPPAARMPVHFKAEALVALQGLSVHPDKDERLIRHCLQADPRPAYASDPNRCYHFRLENLDVDWFACEDGIEVSRVRRATKP